MGGEKEERSRSAWIWILGWWVVPALGLGLAVGLDLVLSNEPMGVGTPELFQITYVQIFALVVPALLLALVAGVLLMGVEDKLRVHAALATGLVVIWFGFGPTNQTDWSSTARLQGRALAVLAGLVVGGGLYRIFPRLRSLRPLAWSASALTGLSLLALLAAGVHLLRLGPWFRSAPTGLTDLAIQGSGFPPIDPPLVRRPDAGKLIVLGIDALDWDALLPLIERGEAPNFARIRREGTVADLQTLYPTESPRIWTSVVTGLEPELHGIVGFDVTQYPELGLFSLYRTRALSFTRPILDLVTDGRRKPISSTERRVKAIWNLCDEAGIPVGMVGWWASWPAEPVSSFIVSDHSFYETLDEVGWSRNVDVKSTHSQTYPPEVLDDLLELYGRETTSHLEQLEPFADLTDDDRRDFAATMASSGGSAREKALRTLSLAIQKDRFYGEGALALFDRHQPEVLLAYLNAVDSFAHAIYDMTVPEAGSLGHSPGDIACFRESMDRVVRHADGWLGRFLERCDENTTLVVLSDHGYGKEPGQTQPPYGHRNAPPGLLILRGPGIRKGHELSQAGIYDIAPTLVHLIGLPLSREMEGTPLLEAMTEEYLAAHPLYRIPSFEAGSRRYQPSGSSAQDEDMMNNLRALGYVR